jgi:uncharacterized protein (DUF58 family)
VTGRAAAFLFAALTLLVVALSTGSSVYYMLLSAMLLLIAFSLLSSLLALWTVRVSIEKSAVKVERGARVSVRLRMRHFGVLPVKAFLVTLVSPERADARHVFELFARPLVERSYEYMLPCPHRGVYAIGVDSIAIEDYFELFSFKRKLRATYEVTVMPHVQTRPSLTLNSGDTGPEFLSRRTEDAASPSGVRAWLEGDPLKKIHWKLSIRKRELMVRTYEESARPDTLILLDLMSVGGMETFALSIEDCLCEAAASIAAAQLDAMYPVKMPLSCAVPTEVVGQSPHDRERFVDALSRVRFDAPHTYEQVLALEFRRMQRTGGVVLITSRLTARVADSAFMMYRMGLRVCVVYISDAKRNETEELISRMSQTGIDVEKINPWAEVGAA